MVAQRLPHELGRRSGIHRYFALHRDGRRRCAESCGDFRQLANRYSERSRHASGVPVCDPVYGGVDVDYPYVREAWTGDNLGDLFLGVKVNAMSETEPRLQPFALAVRALFKVPAGDKEKGTSTGEVDFGIDAIASKELSQVAELSGSLGYYNRGDPDDFTLSDSIRWGIGAAFPTRSALKRTTEPPGESNFESDVISNGTFTAVDGSIAPLSSQLRDPVTFAVGATYQTRSGIFAGMGINWSSKAEDREEAGFPDDEDAFGTKFGWQFRIGYHPPTVLRLPVVPPPPPPPPPVVVTPPEHILSVKAMCDPCVVQVGQTSTVTATPNSSIGCAVTYQWTAPAGTLASPTQQQSVWTAPQQPGTVPVTVTVTCPTDKRTATAATQIQVTQPPVKQFIFEDVYFDFDRFSLTDAALRVLADAATTLRENPTLRVRIEGNTCNIGTAEYNLALGAARRIGAAVFHLERHRRRSTPDDQLRGRTAEVRQLARRNAATQPARRIDGSAGDALNVGSCSAAARHGSRAASQLMKGRAS